MPREMKWVPVQKCIDFLTATVGTNVGKKLVMAYPEREPGYAGRGFAASEKRSRGVWECWRRYQPYQKSPTLGDDYECWECSGGSSQHTAHIVRKLSPVRPSRVDVAFDFWVVDAFSADSFIDLVRGYVGEGHLGINGHGGVNTLYINKSDAPRRLRVYRKDKQDPFQFFAPGDGPGCEYRNCGAEICLAEHLSDEVELECKWKPLPVLRVELQLRGDRAADWWRVHCEGEGDGGWPAAVAHIEELTGRRIVDDVGSVPERQPKADADAMEHLKRFLTQNGRTLEALLVAGVPVNELSCALAAKRDKVQSHRREKVLRKYADVDMSGVILAVRKMLEF